MRLFGFVLTWIVGVDGSPVRELVRLLVWQSDVGLSGPLGSADSVVFKWL